MKSKGVALWIHSGQWVAGGVCSPWQEKFHRLIWAVSLELVVVCGVLREVVCHGGGGLPMTCPAERPGRIEVNRDDGSLGRIRRVADCFFSSLGLNPDIRVSRIPGTKHGVHLVPSSK